MTCKKLLALILGCWGTLVVNCAAVASDVPEVFSLDTGAQWKSHPTFLSLSVLAVIGMAMVPAVPLRRASIKNINDTHGHSGNGNGSRAENGQPVLSLHEEYREIFEGTADLVYAHDLDGCFTLINPAGLRLLGYTADEVKGLNIKQIVAPEYRKLVRPVLSDDEGLEETRVYEVALVTKAGKRRMVEISSRIVCKNGSPVSIYGIARDVTNRKRAEVAAAEGSELLDVLLENSKDMIYFKDRASRFVRYSSELARHFGAADIDQLKGKSDFDFFTRDHAQAAYEDEQEVMRSSKAVVGKLEVETHKDGRVTWARTTKVPWRDKTGKIIGIVGISTDVTALKETEDRLASEQQLLRTLLDNVPDSIYFKDRQSRFVSVSKSMAAKTLGHVPTLRTTKEKSGSNGKTMSDTDLLIGLTDFDTFTEEHARPAFQDEQEIIRSGKPIIGKVEKETRADGSNSWCLTTKMPWRDKDGNIVGTFGISRDITALKQAEENVAYERELFQTLLDTFPDNIYFKDRDSRFVRFSKSKVRRTLKTARELHRVQQREAPADWPLHLSSEEHFAEFLLGKSDFDTVPSEFARRSFEEERLMMDTGVPVIGKLEQMPNTDGQKCWMLVTKMPWKDRDGRILGTFGVSRDVTALKEAELELEATHKRLLQASRLAGMAEVATDVLHNVGNVLNSVNVSCSLVIDRVQESSFSNLARIPEIIKENTGRLEEFLTADPKGKHLPEYLASLAQTSEDQKTFLLHELNQLRNHIDHIKQVVSMQQNYAKVAGVEETIEVSQLVGDALHINADALHRHSVAYQKEFEPVPAIMVDKHKVLQILVNLIRNAKYAVSDSPRRDKLMTVRIRRKGEDWVQIEVADNGVGIPPENLTRIFAHGFTTRRDGHGFGLHSGALAARDLGGSLTVHSDGVDKGATFTLELPLKRKQETT
jgi:PAS domain S-box-containing protein